MSITGATLEAIAQHLEAVTAGLSAIAIAGTCAVPVDAPTYEPLPLDQVAEQVEAIDPLSWVVGWTADGVPIADDADNLIILEDGSVVFPMWCGFSGWTGPVETLSGDAWPVVTDYWLADEIALCF